MADRELFKMNAHGDTWQELELFDQADMSASGDSNVTAAEFATEHRAAMRARHRERVEAIRGEQQHDDDAPPFWDAFV